ncbi:hypothetical protein DFR58_10171 [Anaerobacterium chartisolvens]|uniref:Uncharacterized protein n=1 Tax=Anaerobacterium chartisolvens TaxID=1297424 RepID=A0A369BH39_9FIRM|nr:hypothetical protein DFR58_10171 [Anaerobacterium chartisolvens]
MSFAKGNLPSAQDFISLKARVKTEMQRRNGYGDLSTYAGAAYDYAIAPKKGEIPRTEHFNRIRDVQASISDPGMGSVKPGAMLQDMTILEAKQTVFEAKSRSATSGNDCSAMCSGMCVTACTTTCTGTCTGSCTNTCTGTCSGTCSGCSGTCSGGCTGCGSGCSGGCTGCGSGCSGGCTGCGSGCSGSCSGSCTGGCTGCGTDCGSGCFYSCKNSCSGCGSGCSGAVM